MSIVVYQGLQSCLESQVAEFRTMMLKLSSPKLSFSQSLEMALQPRVAVPGDCDSQKADSPIIPDLLHRLSVSKPCDKLQGPYVHPSPKHYSSCKALSEKSLNLCTENLGSETGSEFIENSIFSCSTAEIKIPVKIEQQQQIRNYPVLEPKKQFPPPLTTLHGPDSLHVRPHREDGRLILKAKRISMGKSCFHVDRTNGRLRLSLAESTTITASCSLKQAKQEDDEKITNKVSN